MQNKIEQLISGQARKLAAPDHPLHFLLYSSNKHLQEDSKYVDLQVGKQVWLNVPRRMRQELWLSVLHRNRGTGATAAKEYATRVRQTLPEDVDADIEKDVGRTFPNAARFASDAGKMSLLRVLRAYAVHDQEVGYCQGMNFLAGLLLTWMPNEATAYAGLVVLMQQQGLRDLYKSDLARLQVYLWQFGRLLPGKLGRHMEGHGVLPVLYLSSWLLTSFASDFPLFFSSRVLDVVLTGSYPHAVLKVPNWSREDLQDILSDALSQAWTPAQEAVLNSEAGMETVIDAVVRVTAKERAAQQPEGASQQAEQQELNSTAADAGTAGCVPAPLPPRTPTKAVSATVAHLSPVQQQAGTQPRDACPLQTISSHRSGSWTDRMRALRTSPSVSASSSPTSINHARRHTTDEAAQPSSQGQWQQGSLLEQRPVPHLATGPSTALSSLSSTLELNGTLQLNSTSELNSTLELSSISVDGQPQTSPSAGSDRDSEAPMAAQAGWGANAEADLLGFAAEGVAKQDGFAKLEGHLQQANGWGSGVNLEHAGGSQQPQLGGSGTDCLTLSQTNVLPASREVPADDPFQHSATLSGTISQSSKQLSGLSMLADSQGSDMDSWGSFRLPDESLNITADVNPDRQAALAQHSRSAGAGGKDGLDTSELSLVLGQVADSQSVQAAAASPTACITNKQRLQLDLFLQSSNGSK
ncbi:hypothetical protein ABBQ38_007223 [Trebouxia sp. C0009 RCD-2024]